MQDYQAPKAGEIVKANLPKIIAYCTDTDPEEVIHLLDPKYCQQTFKLGPKFPFFKTPANIGVDGDTVRFWTDVHHVLDHDLRVTSQWTMKTHIPSLFRYLLDKGLTPVGVTPEFVEAQLALLTPIQAIAPALGGPRFRSTAMGDAQNLAVRYILGNLEFEAFSEKDWLAVKADFGPPVCVLRFPAAAGDGSRRADQQGRTR